MKFFQTSHINHYYIAIEAINNEKGSISFILILFLQGVVNHYIKQMLLDNDQSFGLENCLKIKCNGQSYHHGTI